jgi:hypothetical protein
MFEWLDFFCDFETKNFFKLELNIPYMPYYHEKNCF